MLRSLFPSLLGVLVALPATAITVSFQNDANGYTGGDHESFSFDGTLPDDGLRIDIANDSHPADSYAWQIFEGVVGEGAVPAGVTVLSATLTAWVTNPFESASLSYLLEHIASRPFGPGAGILDAIGSFYDANLLSASHPGGCVTSSLCDPALPIVWDVTAIVQAWVDGAANHGFVLLPETANGGNLTTNDHTDPAIRPLLVVEYQPGVITVPEPRSLLLLGLGLLGLGAFGRVRDCA